MKQAYDYEVIIIGAGISGLVCGCYLAKSGLKVAVIEQHSLPGGYCTSFQRKGYKFDSSVHYIGGIRKGVLSNVLDDLEIKNEITFKQCDPADKIILPDSTVSIRANPYDTISEFQKSFPEEKANVENYFRFLIESNITKIHRETSGKTFEQLLSHFFISDDIKASIAVLLLGNMGLPPSKIPAFTSAVFCREFLLDPGYYPQGGMQEFTDSLVKKLKQYGGELMLSTKVSKIFTADTRAAGVSVDSTRKLNSKFVVSSIDATQTFKSLIDIKTKESVVVDKLMPSNSVFAVYLGLKADLSAFLNGGCNTWLVSTKDMEGSYFNLSKNIAGSNIPLAMLFSPSAKDVSASKYKPTMQIFTIATYQDHDFWVKNRDLIADKMLSLAERAIPKIREHIELMITATPFTFSRYTLNKNGAAFGWASTIEQTATSVFPQVTSIKNLLLAGHWSIMGAGQGGISTVALSGRKAAEYITNYS